MCLREMSDLFTTGCRQDAAASKKDISHLQKYAAT